MKRQDVTPSIFTIADVFTAAECTHLIAFADAQGFDVATINAWGGPRLMLSVSLASVTVDVSEHGSDGLAVASEQPMNKTVRKATRRIWAASPER